MPQYLTDRDISGMLKCSRSTVWRMVEAGRLPRPVKFGGMTRWNAAAVLAALDA